MTGTHSVYIIGGAGSGKSTFIAELTEGMTYGPFTEVHTHATEKDLGRPRVLRSHYLDGGRGIYVGQRREEFPGADGLDKVISPTAEHWVQTCDLPAFLVSEGMNLATKRFLGALREHTKLMVVHLWAEPDEIRRRFDQRGSAQAQTFVDGSVTRADNTFNWLRKEGVRNLLPVRSDRPEDWDMAVDVARAWIQL